MNAYAARDRLLRKMGYASYDEYLASPLWLKIRAKAYARAKSKGGCRLCGARPDVVHHTSYSSRVLRGLDLKKLSALCNRCHTLVEFDPATGRKRSMDQAKVVFNRVWKVRKATIKAARAADRARNRVS